MAKPPPICDQATRSHLLRRHYEAPTDQPGRTMKRYPLIAIAIAMLVACSTPNSNLPDTTTVTSVQTPTTEITLERLGKMTPEQIEKLSPEQLADIEKKVDTDVAKIEATLPALETGNGQLSAQAASNCGSYVSPAWPNAALTKKCAIYNGYKYYETYIYNTFYGPDWKDDGCSTVPDYVFLGPCRHHDFAYRNLPQYGQFRNATTRKLADERFYVNMIDRCKDRYSWYDPRRSYCKSVAFTYYSGVRVGGSSAYYNAKQRYP
jgi:Prokaryotic phospholipase A2